jgi:hypothetical protein
MQPASSVAPATRPSPKTKTSDSPPGSPVSTTSPGSRFLTSEEWAKLAHGLGAVQQGSESHSLVHPTSYIWPPRGLPSGLYRDVVTHEAIYQYKFHVISSLRWAIREF